MKSSKKIVLKEFVNPSEPNSGIQNAIKLINAQVALIDLLKPRSTKESQILKTLEDTIKALRKLFSGNNALNNFKHPGAPEPVSTPNSDDESVLNDTEIKTEMTSAAGGAFQGSTRRPWWESNSYANRLRGHIQNILEELYQEDKSLFINEVIEPGSPVTQSTGLNYLGELFLQIRPTIEKKYMQLTTSEAQRQSFQEHLIKLYIDLLNNIDMNQVAGEQNKSTNESKKRKVNEAQENSADGIYFGNDGNTKPKQAEVSDEEKQKVNNQIPGLDPTGNDAALEIYNSTNKQIQQKYAGLGDPQDRQIFKEYLPKNVRALFELLNEQFPINNQEDMQDPSLSEMPPEPDNNQLN